MSEKYQKSKLPMQEPVRIKMRLEPLSILPQPSADVLERIKAKAREVRPV